MSTMSERASRFSFQSPYHSPVEGTDNASDASALARRPGEMGNTGRGKFAFLGGNGAEVPEMTTVDRLSCLYPTAEPTPTTDGTYLYLRELLEGKSR